MKEVEYEDTQILIGNNIKDNNILLMKYNHTDYIWLHLKAYPSSHVVILDNNPTEDTLLFAANLCRESTKYKNLKNLKVNYTKYNNLRKTPKEGAVSFKSNRQVRELKI